MSAPASLGCRCLVPIRFFLKDSEMNVIRRATLFRMLGISAGFAAAASLVACGGGGSAEPAAAAPAPAAGPAGAACVPGAHAKVGKTGALATRSHGVSGRVTLVDSCTLEITNFNYDGLGLSRVEVYGGLAGNYRNGFAIGPNLRGTAFTGQTLRVSLQPGDIDKLDGISIWCSDANVSFGDVTLS